ncbi:MAG: hypothetical protein HN472_07910 [Nitrospina sp.]|jgi:hypothetical protein|nr:hypothetical protein [Nitrospina sp.]MBT3509453.1 hypothetical protein [Nitrospina sp.]MBT3876996.1 hypothetical protein [Nitrospina sp.]MBT4048809.1 hypothetical protein [Nitrospina sp.]MBT4556138.1 hypothetical protein [Nitrospina sp.]
MNRVIFIFLYSIFIFNVNCVFAQNLQDQSSAAGRQIGQTVGGMAGGAAGNFASGGNIAATTAGSEVGRQVGGVVGEQTIRAIGSKSNASLIDSKASLPQVDETQKSSLSQEGLGKTEKEISSVLDFP